MSLGALEPSKDSLRERLCNRSYLASQRQETDLVPEVVPEAFLNL